MMNATIAELLAKYPSDKLSAHSYCPIYEELFAPYRQSATAILEIGIEHGQSLRAWREYFMFAHIYGMDNEASKIFRDNRITCVHCDTTERDRILAIRHSLPDFDIIIDDASHVVTEQIWSVAVFWPKLKPGGIMVIEDILYPQYLELFQCFQNVTLHDLRHVRNQHDDMLAVIRKN